MNKAVGAFLLAIAIAGPACAGERPPKSISDLGGRRVHFERDIVDVAIAPADRTRVEEWETGSHHERIKVLTGPLWASVFRGDPNSRPVFTITSSKVFEESAGGGMSTRVTYAIEGTLSSDGRDYPIQAQGAQSSGRDGTHAFGAAATKCVILAARQVSRILAGGRDTPPPGDDRPADAAAPK
jgi:hypothetical protein